MLKSLALYNGWIIGILNVLKSKFCSLTTFRTDCLYIVYTVYIQQGVTQAYVRKFSGFLDILPLVGKYPNVKYQITDSLFTL